MQKPVSYICEEKIEDKYFKDEKYRKVRDHCQYIEQYRRASHNICNLRYSVHKKIPLVFHNESNYDYKFVIKE